MHVVIYNVYVHDEGIQVFTISPLSSEACFITFFCFYKNDALHV